MRHWSRHGIPTHTEYQPVIPGISVLVEVRSLREWDACDVLGARLGAPLKLEKFDFEDKKKYMICKLTLQYGKEDPLLLQLF